MYRSSPLRSTLNTGYITGLHMCQVMYRSSPLRSTSNTGYITGLDMCQVMYRSSPLRSTSNTGYSTGLDMCKVCTEAVHCAAHWTCVQVQKNVIIPTPPHPTLSHVMCAQVTLGGKNDAKMCLCVLVTPVCVRGWLWKMAVCARDSSLCSLQNGSVRTWLQSVCAGDSRWKKGCKIVPVCTCDSRVCARVTPWPPGGFFHWVSLT